MTRDAAEQILYAKRQAADFQIMDQWVKPNSKVLDLGCGDGALLSYLNEEKNVFGIGVDNDIEKIKSCVAKNIPIYQGEIQDTINIFPDNFFDYVIFSRTVDQLSSPGTILKESLRIGQRLIVGFINNGFWINRLNFSLYGNRTINTVFPDAWHESRRSNPFSLDEFESFCRCNQIQIHERVCLQSDWKTPCRIFPNLLAGYVIYELSR
jgi:methionine biosynthesis protein MetW